MIYSLLKFSTENETDYKELRNYKSFWLVYLHPLILFTGILSNFAVFCLMPKINNSLTFKIRMYYISLAVFDFLTLISYHLLQVFLGDSLYLATNGANYLFIDKKWTFSCKMSWFIWYFFMSSAGYCYLKFCIERMLIVRMPMKAKRLLDRSGSRLLWILIVIIPSLTIASLVFYVKDIQPHADAVEGVICETTSNTNLRMVYCVGICGFVYLVHVSTSLLCNIVIVKKLADYSKSRLKLMTIVRANISSKELKATITILLLSMVHISLYFPTGVLCIIFCFLDSRPLEIRMT